MAKYPYQDQSASARTHAKVVVGTAFGHARALFVGTGGNLVVEDLDGTVAAYLNIPNGSILPVQCKRVLASGDGQTTTAANVVAWF